MLRSSDPARFGSGWIDGLRKALPDIDAAVLKLRNKDGLRRAACWPGPETPPELDEAAQAAMARGSGVARQAGGRLFAAYPVQIDGSIAGVTAVVTSAGSAPEDVLDALRWSAGWLRAWALDAARAADGPSLDRARRSIEILAGTLDEEGFATAARRAVTELAQLASCDRVSFGLRRGGQVRIAAISNTAQFARKLDVVRHIRAAMEEAIDQQTTILYPAPEGDAPHVDRCHAALVRSTAGVMAMTIPVLARGRFLGAFTFERMGDAPFDQPTVDLLCAAATLSGSMLAERQRADRWAITRLGDEMVGAAKRLFGPGHIGLKLSTAAILAAGVFFSFAKTEYRVTSEAVLEGAVQRTLTAPYDGFVSEAAARAGDRVAAGDVIARLDDRDLTLESLRLGAERKGFELEYEEALGLRDRARLNVLRAQIEQIEAQMTLVESQLQRAVLVAPFDGLLVSGDLSQSIGASVARGDALFEIAPLQDYRVTIWVEERQVADIADGMEGAIVLSALPSESFPVTIRQITPVAEIHEGLNTFRVEAALEQGSTRLRPGMNGIAKIDAGERLLIWTWTRGMADWGRLQLWRWFG